MGSASAAMVRTLAPFSLYILVCVAHGRTIKTKKIQINNTSDTLNSQGECVCPAITQWIRPRLAQNTDGQIAFVVNTPKFSQQVKIVTCKKDSRLGWKTNRCFQQFSEVELHTVHLGGDEDLEQEQKLEISGRGINSQ